MNTINTLKEIAHIDILRASEHKTDFTLYEVFLTAPMAFKEVLEGIGWVYIGGNEYKYNSPPVCIEFRRKDKLTNPSKRIFLKEVVQAIIKSFDIYITDDVFGKFSEEIEGMPVSLMKNIVKDFITIDINDNSTDINTNEEEKQTTDINKVVTDIDINIEENKSIDIYTVEKETFGEQAVQENKMSTIDINDNSIDIYTVEQEKLMENQENIIMKELSLSVKTHSELKKAEIDGKFEKEGVTFKVEGRKVIASKAVSKSEYNTWEIEIEDYILSRMEEIYMEKCHAYAAEHERKWLIEEEARINKLKEEGLIDEDGNDIEDTDTDITDINTDIDNNEVVQENPVMSEKDFKVSPENIENVVRVAREEFSLEVPWRIEEGYFTVRESEDSNNNSLEDFTDYIENIEISSLEISTEEEEEVLGVHSMQENSENNVNNVNDNDNVLKLSELKGLPLFNYSKKPYIEWSKYDNGQEQELWPTKNGNINIIKKTGEFFKTGENAWAGRNIIVIDIDSTYDDSTLQYDITNKFLQLEGYDRDISGEERKEALRKYVTATAVSGSGGLHMYFTYPDDVELKNTQSKIIKGVDTRANGGIILLPGTQSKSDKYEGIREYKLVSEEILPIPEKLLEELVNIQKPTYIPPITSGELISIEDSSLDSYRKAAVRNTVIRLEETTANRNEMLTECARTLGMLLIEENVAYELLAEASGKIGLPHSEFVATFNSAYHWGTQHPKKIEKKTFENKTLSSLERKIRKIEENRNIDDIDILNTSEKSKIDINTVEDEEDNQSSQENTFGVQGEQLMQENKVNIPAPENIEIIEEVKKVEKEVRDSNDNNDNNDSGIINISDEEKKQLTFEIDSHARNLWEYEIDKVDVLRVSDVNKFAYYDNEDFVWKETETPGHKLREYRRNKINDFKKLGYKYQLDISRTIRSMETESFITAGKNTIVDSKGVKNEVFNNSKTEILIKNGVLDATNGKVRPATSKDYFTKKINTKYERTFEELINDSEYSEAYEKFEKVFKNFGSKEIRDYMQGILGNSLFAMPNRTSVSFWWYSKGSSGKSAIINALENTLSEFASRPAGDVFLASGDNFEFVTMEGSRVAFVEEAPSGWLHAGKLKKVVGTEKASMRNLHEKARKVTVTWTAHVSINNLPKVRPSDFDFGTLRRIMILPFFAKYEKQEADVTLMSIADDEKVREIVLAWLVEGAKKWYADIDFEKRVPLEIIKATEDFYSTVEADVDPMSDFVNNIIPSENHYINADDLFEGWMEYCKRNNIVHKDNSLRTIQRLEEKIGEKLTPKVRAKGMVNSSYVLLYPEYVNNKSDDPNSQKKRLLGYKYTK